jgi:hypothetical protein
VAAIAPYLITAGSTLTGVAITGVLAELRERRKSREDREREQIRRSDADANWIRTERRKSYAALVETGYAAANLYLDAASRLFDRGDPDGAKGLWVELDRTRDELKLRVADVSLLGTPQIVDASFVAANISSCSKPAHERYPSHRRW